MEINVDKKRITNQAVLELITYLENHELDLCLQSAQLYYDFPILKDADDVVVIAPLLLVSEKYGIVAIRAVDLTDRDNVEGGLAQAASALDDLCSLLYSRLIRNRILRRTATELAIPTFGVVYAPLLAKRPAVSPDGSKLVGSAVQLARYLTSLNINAIPSELYAELIATIEGAKGIIRPKPRVATVLDPRSKVALANRIEQEITRFDKRQKHGAMPVLDGFQRIRGLAGSGKTVVLAMKAALTHLRDPDATIVYTFFTKSLYQHIQRLITRFYRQFDDKDPDWTRLRIMHGWGGQTGEGVYYNACRMYGAVPVTLSEARKQAAEPFDYACRQLLSAAHIAPAYDYMLIDEGQDFPASFVQLCIRLTHNQRVVYAYDDLQTIFQPTAPSIAEIVGVDAAGRPLVELREDVILDKCYRNPRETLVCAHALGFGIYGKIVQMLENREQWEDVGYRVCSGDFVAGSLTEIERPEANSLMTISENQAPSDIVQAQAFDSFEAEINSTVDNIAADVADGLRPDDILVITVDDRYARTYLSTIARGLAEHGIESNNIHADSYGIRDFQKEGRVTLSTVHKAKGNEAFMVYVVGVDALYGVFAGPRERNVLFTAMTRAKGWVRLSGVGESAADCKAEVERALSFVPFLRFTYPDARQIRTIKRDLAVQVERKHRAERKLDEILDLLSPEEVERLLAQRMIKKGD